MRRIVFILFLASSAPNAHAQPSPIANCKAAIPASLAGAGAGTWLGPCSGRSADGLGVLRVTSWDAANPRFFFGLMVAGQPLRGVITTAPGLLEVAPAFDTALRIVPGDGADASPDNAAIVAAMEGAHTTARSFAAAGNAASAAYYRDWAGRLGVE